MMIFKKSIPRRTLLRGAGATLALPLLDSMVPAFATNLDTSQIAAKRLMYVYVPNGIIMEQWTPATEGADYAMTPILQPLAGFRENFLVLTGLSQLTAHKLSDEAAGDHARGSATWLTGVHPRKTAGTDIHVGVSADQIAAKELGSKTQLASLEVSLDPNELLGACETGYSCAYTNTLSWRSATTPLPMENNPRTIFERLFGDSESTDAQVRLSRIHEDRSLLDFLSGEVKRLTGNLGANDRAKFNEYLDAVRDVERRIQLAEAQSAHELPSLEKPAGSPSRYDDYAKLMYDLILLAFQTDMTRVNTFYMSREESNRTYPEIGVFDPHHPLSHHMGDETKIKHVVQINIFHAKLFAYFLDKMRNTKDGDGSMLDHSMIVYGSGLSNGNIHSHDNLPLMVVGSGGGQIKGGRHIRYTADTPMTNLHLSLLDRMGIELGSLGDSTGRLEL